MKLSNARDTFSEVQSTESYTAREGCRETIADAVCVLC